VLSVGSPPTWSGPPKGEFIWPEHCRCAFRTPLAVALASMALGRSAVFKIQNAALFIRAGPSDTRNSRRIRNAIRTGSYIHTLSVLRYLYRIN